MSKLSKITTRIFTVIMTGMIAITIAVTDHLRMPGKSYGEPLPTLTAPQVIRRESLLKDVRTLSEEIGVREQGNALEKTIALLSLQLPQQQAYQFKGITYQNRSLEIRGQTKPDEIVVIGAHYDTVSLSPGADDNASGIAALLSLAKQFENTKFEKTVRFVAFAQEELGLIGSQKYAERSKQLGEKIVAMLSLEMLGYYTDRSNSQAYPVPVGNLYPDRGNYLAFVSNLQSRELLRSAISSFRSIATIPSEGLALPEMIKDIGRSDHGSFWRSGYPAVLVSDTANFRNPHYHKPTDRVSTLDADRFTFAVDGLAKVVQDLAN
jgi:Peptidase family M28